MELVFTCKCKCLFGKYINEGEPKANCPHCGEEVKTTLMSNGCQIGDYHNHKRSYGVIGDIEPYKSPIDGKMVTSRSKHRDHMRQHGVIEMGNEYPKQAEPNNAPMGRAGNDIVQAMGGR
jgi:hypothetical protein